MKFRFEQARWAVLPLGFTGVLALICIGHFTPSHGLVLDALAGGIGALTVLLRFGPDVAVGATRSFPFSPHRDGDYRTALNEVGPSGPQRSDRAQRTRS